MVGKLVTWSVTLSAVAALGLVGGAGNGPAGDPSQTLERMLVAMGSGAYDKACRLTAVDGRAVEGAAAEACADAMRVYAEGVRPSAVRALRDAEVPSVDADGSTAQVRGDRVAGARPPFSQAVYQLVRIDDKWYVVSR